MTSLKIAQQKHAEYFYTLVGKANRLHRSQAPSIGLSEMDSEWGNIVLAFDFLKYMFQDDVSFAVLCNNYVSESGFYLRLRRHPLEYLSWLQTATEVARMLEEPGVENNHLGNIGNCYYRMGNFDQAITTFEINLQCYQKMRNLLGEARTLTGIGAVHAAKGETQTAIQYFEKSLGIAEATEEWALVANALLNLGGAYNDNGNPAQALPLLERAIELFSSNNDHQGKIQALNNVATAYILLGESNKAINQLVNALQEANKLGAKREVAHVLGNLGIIFADLQKFDQAIMLLRESLDISLQIGENYLANITQQNLSILLNRKKQVGS